jgi:membrane protein DedA with SNARE-associated domain
LPTTEWNSAVLCEARQSKVVISVQLFLLKYGLLAVFLAAMLEADVVPVLTGVVAHQAYLKAGSAILAASAGALAGDCIWFWAGHRYSKTIQNSGPYRRVGSMAERLIRRLGVWQIPASHVIYGTRVATMIFWGVQRLPIVRFLLIDAVGCFVFTTLLFTLGFEFSRSASLIVGRVKRIEVLMLVAVIVFGSMFSLINKMVRQLLREFPTGERGAEGR